MNPKNLDRVGKLILLLIIISLVYVLKNFGIIDLIVDLVIILAGVKYLVKD